MAAKEQVLREAAEELRRLREETERARRDKALFLSQFRALLQGYLDSLGRLEEK
jgi:cell division initiation protein